MLDDVDNQLVARDRCRFFSRMGIVGLRGIAIVGRDVAIADDVRGAMIAILTGGVVFTGRDDISTSLTPHTKPWRMTCSRELLVQRPSLYKVASSVYSTRPDLGEALGEVLREGCKACLLPEF